MENYSETKAEIGKTPDQVPLEKKALSYVMDALCDNLFRKYIEQSTMTDLWDALKTDYETTDAQLQFVLRNKFLTCKKSRNERMTDYIDRLTSLSQDLTSADCTVTEPDFILTLLNGTHEEFGNFVSAACSKKAAKDLKKNELISLLIKEDDLQRSMNQNRASNLERRVMYTNNSNGYRNKYAKKSNSVKNRKCYNCGIPGHYANECKRMKSEVKAVSFDKTSSNREKEYVCIEKDTYEEGDDFVRNIKKQRICTLRTFSLGESTERNKWLLDSGASTHACNDPSMFESIRLEDSKIFVGDDRGVDVTGRGVVKLRVSGNGQTNVLTLEDVALVPDLAANLVSTGRLEESGITITTEKGMSKLTLRNQLICCAVRTSENPYLYEFKRPKNDSVLVTLSNKRKHIIGSENPFELKRPKIDSILVTKSNNTTDWSIWHQRLGHLSGTYMNKLNPIDVEILNNETTCEACCLCKARKQPHIKKDQARIDEERLAGLKIGVIHSDLMGPMKTKTLSGCRYVLTYICSNTEYSYVYLLKSKNEQSSFFKEFKALYEKQSGFKIKELRSDNGLEYFSNEFQDYLRSEGIRHLTSVAYVPQMNGKAERLNLNLLLKARTMMFFANVSEFLWGSAILTANYLRNRSPCKTINFKTPYELMNGKIPTMAHLRIFGCTAYPLIVNEDRHKFDPTAEQHCIMIGYDDHPSIYWLYNKSKRTVFRSRDVKFNENINYNDSYEMHSIDNDDWFENDELIQSDNETVTFEKTAEEEDNENHHAIITTDSDSIPIEETYGPIEMTETENSNIPTAIIRSSSRNRNKVEKLQVDPKKKIYMMNNIGVYGLSDPKTIKEALSRPDRDQWKQAIESELKSINENNVWTIVKRPFDKIVIGTKWVFKIKKNAKNEPEKYKARLVAKGYNQEYGIDYNETFAPVVKVQTLRILFAIAANNDLIIHQVDINTAFLNGDLDEEVYVENPPGCEGVFNKENVCKLQKSLYGLKQAPRAWNKTLVKFLSEFGLIQLKSDVCVFTNKELIVAIYVDDIIIASKNLNRIIDFKQKLSTKFKTQDLGEANYILKIKVEKIRGGGWKLDQKNYIDDLIKLYDLTNQKNVELPIQPNHRLTINLNEENDNLKQLVDSTKYRQAIGKLMYLMVCTRPDISYAVSMLSRFMKQPREKHWRFVVQLLKYVKSTRDYSLVYPNSNNTILTGYSDSDHAGDLGDRKSTSGFIFMLSKSAVSWKSTKQATVAISSTEAEYIALSQASTEAIWLKELLNELGYPQKQITLCGDNLSSMQIVKNPESHNRTKHIDVRFHFIRDHYEKGNIGLQFIESEKLCADFLTKGVNRVKHL